METTWNEITAAVAAYAPRVLGAIAILGVGWLVALGVSAGVRALLRRTTIDDRVVGWLRRDPGRARVDASAGIAKGVYYLVMIFVLVAFFQSLGLTLITEPLNHLLNQVFAFAPKLLAAGALLLVALLAATALKKILARVLDGSRFDDRVAAESGDGARRVSVSNSIAETVYWLVLLLFLPAILGALGLEGLLAPVQGLASEILSYIPNILAAGIILLVGWFVARVVQRVVTNLLAAAGLDRVGERAGLQSALGSRQLSGVVGIVVYALILIPVIVGALNALQLEAVTAPVSGMLAAIVSALPNLFAATVVVVLAIVVGRLVAGLVGTVLSGVGFDTLPTRLGLVREGTTLRRTPSQVVSTIVLLAILLFASAEAATLLGFQTVSLLIGEFTVFGGHVLLGMVILAVALFLANLAASAVRATGVSHASLLSGVARAAVIVLGVAMALRQMGFANEIINLAFGLMLGSVAVAFAIAFGLGGRDSAARQLETWRGSLPAPTRSSASDGAEGAEPVH